MADWHGTKGMRVDRKLDQLCDYEFFTLTLDFQGQILKKLYIRNGGGSIDMEQKGFGSIDCWTHYVSLAFVIAHDIEPGFSRSNFK